MAQIRKAPYHYPIDVIRLVAAFSICWAHLSVYSWASTTSSTAKALGGAARLPWAGPSAWWVWVALEVLFVVSGFLIAQSASGSTMKRFVHRRLLRLYPAICVCASITLVARIAFGPDGPRALVGPFARTLVLWPTGPWIDGVYWSLTVELAFYGLIVLLLASRRFAWLPILAWTLMAASAAFLLLDFTGLGQLGGRPWRFLAAHADPLLLRYGVFFSVGIWLWLLSERRMTPARWIGLGLGLVFGGLEIWLRAAAFQAGEVPISAGQPMWAPILVFLVVMGALAFFTRTPARFTPGSDAAKRRLRQAGLLTYPLFLLHNVIGASLIRALVRHGVSAELALAGAILFSLALAAGVALLVEPAIRGLLDGFAKGRVQLAPAGRTLDGVALGGD